MSLLQTLRIVRHVGQSWILAWLADERGDVTLEWIIVAAIVLAVVGMSVVAVAQALAGRFDALAGSL